MKFMMLLAFVGTASAATYMGKSVGNVRCSSNSGYTTFQGSQVEYLNANQGGWPSGAFW